ncbi:MAG: hypothetical protein R3C05_25895 [Pirellulaceae bacterium]
MAENEVIRFIKWKRIIPDHARYKHSKFYSRAPMRQAIESIASVSRVATDEINGIG